MIFSKRRIIGLVVIVSVLISAILVLVREFSQTGLQRLDGLLSLPSAVFLLSLYVCHFLAEPLRWAAYAHHSIGQAHFARVFSCFNVTALLSYSLPLKLGLPLRMFLLSHYLKMPSANIVGFMAQDGILAILVWGSVALPLLLSLPMPSGTLPLPIPASPLLTGLVLAGCATVLLWFAVRKRRLPLRELTMPPSIAALAVAVLLLDIALYGLRHLAITFFLDIDIDAFAIFAVSIISVFAGIISALPMGLGVYDAGMVALMGLYGVELELALIVALINRLGMIMTSILLGVPSLPPLMRAKPEANLASQE